MLFHYQGGLMPWHFPGKGLLFITRLGTQPLMILHYEYPEQPGWLLRGRCCCNRHVLRLVVRSQVPKRFSVTPFRLHHKPDAKKKCMWAQFQVFFSPSIFNVPSRKSVRFFQFSSLSPLQTEKGCKPYLVPHRATLLNSALIQPQTYFNSTKPRPGYGVVYM